MTPQQPREHPRCDCGQQLHARDLVLGFCPRCGQYIYPDTGPYDD